MLASSAFAAMNPWPLVIQSLVLAAPTIVGITGLLAALPICDLMSATPMDNESNAIAGVLGGQLITA